MPTYIEMLRMADYGEVFDSFSLYFQSSGAFGVLSLILLAASWVSMFCGLLPGKRFLIGVGLLCAAGCAVVGWVGSYSGYRTVFRIVTSSGNQPTDSELIAGANHMAWSAVMPTLAMAVTFGAGMLLLGFLIAFGKKRA